MAQVTALEPATAAIIPQPTTFTCNNPPGKLDSIGARPLNISEESLVLKSISPIHINKGKAVNAQFQLASHKVLARRDPTGAGVKNSSNIYPKVINAGATHIPKDKRKRSKINKINDNPVAINFSSKYYLSILDQHFLRMMAVPFSKL